MRVDRLPTCAALLAKYEDRSHLRMYCVNPPVCRGRLLIDSSRTWSESLSKRDLQHGAILRVLSRSNPAEMFLLHLHLKFNHPRSLGRIERISGHHGVPVTHF